MDKFITLLNVVLCTLNNSLFSYVLDEQDEDDGNFCVVAMDDINCKAEKCFATDDFARKAGKADKKSSLHFACSCKFNDKEPCSLLFMPADLKDLRASHQAMQRDELDISVLTQIRTGIHNSKTTIRLKQKDQTERKKVRVDYFHQGHRICRNTFMYMHGIFKGRLTSLIAHFLQHGVVVRRSLWKHKSPAKELVDL